MRDVSNANFGLLIAFVIPGFTTVWGMSPYVPTFQRWLHVSNGDVPTVGGFLFVSLASVAVGVIVSAIRWAIIDPVHHATGIQRPRFDDQRLEANVTAFQVLVEHHYRYYQFYANMFVVVMVTRLAPHLLGDAAPNGWTDVGAVVLGLILLVASRDTLRKYYERTAQLLGELPRENRPTIRWPGYLFRRVLRLPLVRDRSRNSSSATKSGKVVPKT